MRRRSTHPINAPTLHVDTTGGSDANGGLSAADALATVGFAARLLGALGGGTIKVVAPGGAPLTGIATLTSAYDITIEALDDPYYWDADGGAYCLLTVAAGLVTVNDCHFTGGSTACAIVGQSTAAAGTGKAVFAGCSFDGSDGDGLACVGVWTSVVCTDCSADGNGEDGFDAKCTAGTPELECVRCTATNNGDEGFTAHDETILTMTDCVSGSNGSGAMTAIDTAVVNIDGLTSTGDYTGTRTGDEGVVTFSAGNSGSLTNSTITGSPSAPGIKVFAGADVTLSGNTSSGNALPDEIA